MKPFAAPGTTNNPVRQPANDRPASITPSPSTPSISTPVQPTVVIEHPDLLGLGIISLDFIEKFKNIILLDEPSLPLPSASSTNSITSAKVPSTDTMDPLRELFTTLPTNVNGGNVTMTNLEMDLQNAFLPSSDSNPSTNASGVMSKDKILALFNTPQTSMATASGMTIRPATMQPPNRMYSNFILY